MVRFLPFLALIWALTCSARADSAPAQSRLALGLGPAFWLELGPSECSTDAFDHRVCKGALHEWYGGARTQVDLDVTRWLRVGGQLGFGFHQDAGSIAELETGLSWTVQRWLFPIGVQAHAHIEPRPRLSLWAGPELLYALRYERIAGDPIQRVPRGGNTVSLRNYQDGEDGESGDLGRDATYDFRSGLMVGANLGLDARLAEHVWLGTELAISFSLTQAGQLTVPLVGTLAMERSMTAMLRAGLILRVLL